MGAGTDDFIGVRETLLSPEGHSVTTSTPSELLPPSEELTPVRSPTPGAALVFIVPGECFRNSTEEQCAFEFFRLICLARTVNNRADR